jgi:hypothetical protein
MEVAGRDRTQNLMPQMMQQPARFQQGGDVALEAFRQGAPEPTLGQQFSAIQQRAMAPTVDIAATPTPRGRVEVPDLAAMVRQNLGDNEEAQAKFSNVVDTLSDPEAGEERVQKVLTESFGAPNTEEGMRRVVSQITGRELPESATVDELNRAISGVALGGAIGGPRSVAERISNALLMGLEAQRETAMGREQFAQQLAVAGARAGAEGVAGFLETPEGEQAAELFRNLVTQRNLTVEAAIATMNEISPGLGERYMAAMSGGQMAPPAATPAPENAQELLTQAREAVEQGRDRGVVEQMLRDMGVDPAGL